MSGEAIGHIEDFIVDDETWQVPYLVIETSNLYGYYGRPVYWEGGDRTAGVSPPHQSESHPG